MKGITSSCGSSINLDDESKNFLSTMTHLKALEFYNLKVTSEIQPGKKLKSEVELWFQHVNRMKPKLQSIETKVKEQGPSWNHKICIKNETQEVERLIEGGRFPKGVVLDDHASTILPTTELVGEDILENTKKIIKWLKQEDVFEIGIYGMGGVGKTALVKNVYNKLRKDTDFGGQVYWVTASGECSLEKLQIDIGKALDVSGLSEKDEMKKSSSLYEKISELGKSVLIVDDLWKSYPLEQIGIPESCGCKLILTTRKSDVCYKMGCKEENLLKIEPLSDPHSWVLFIKNLKSYPSEHEEDAKKIVKECGGLPLALRTMGCCMRGKANVQDWTNALNDLKIPLNRRSAMDEDVFRILKFSFDNLEDRVQNCFLSCVLFPEDHEVRPKELVDLWIYEGLFDEIESREGKVCKGNGILKTLEEACLLEAITNCYNVRIVKMHDLIRDMAIIITKKHPRFMAKSGVKLKTVPEGEQWEEDLMKVSLSYNNIKAIPSAMAPMTKKLSVLLLNDNHSLVEIPKSFFVHMEALKILDLSGTMIKRLPKSVSKLKNLRLLSLRGCWKLTFVPSLEKLTKLRVLDLEGTRLRASPEGIEAIVSLENITYCPWDVSDIEGFNRFIDSLHSLTDYRFWLTESPHDDDLCVEFWGSNRAVTITDAEFGEKETLALPSTKIEYLRINTSDMNGRNLGDVFPSLSGATHLQMLYIIECTGLKYVVASPSMPQEGCSIYPQFDTLDYLHLEMLPDLTRVIAYGVSHCFNLLRQLYIENCPKLKVVLPFTVNFQNLEVIHVRNCEEVEEIFESNNGNDSNPDLSLPEVRLNLFHLPKLSSIYRGLLSYHSSIIQNCPKLNNFGISHQIILGNLNISPWNVSDIKGFNRFIDSSHSLTHYRFCLTSSVQRYMFADYEFVKSERAVMIKEAVFGEKETLALPATTIELLIIKECEMKGRELGDVFPSLGGATSLQKIIIDEFRGLEYLVSSSSRPQEGCSIYPAFDTLISLGLHRLPDLTRILEYEVSCSFSNLGCLKITECPKLKVVFPFNMGLNLPKLKYIRVDQCEEVEVIFESNNGNESNPIVAPKLRLDLVCLPKLSSIYRGLLLCKITWEACPKLNLLRLSDEYALHH